jgi:hypothetical protein
VAGVQVLALAFNHWICSVFIVEPSIARGNIMHIKGTPAWIRLCPSSFAPLLSFAFTNCTAYASVGSR